MNNKTIIDKIRSVNVSEIIRHYLNLSRKGANYLAICPFHQDSNPSLTINDPKNIWKCFVCGESGDAINFVRKYKNLSYSQAVVEIANILNFSLEEIKLFKQQNKVNEQFEKYYKINRVYSEYCQSFLESDSNSLASNYLKLRRLSSNAIKKFMIGYNPNHHGSDLAELLTNKNEQYINLSDDFKFDEQDLITINLININNHGNVVDTFSGRIIFPITNKDNEIIGFSGRDLCDGPIKYLNTNENIIFHKSDNFYNFYNATKSQPQTLFLVEGFMDAIAIDQSGIENVIALMGTSFTSNHLKLLQSYKPLTTIILALDNDEPGYNASIKIGMILKKYYDVYYVNKYDSQYKDIDEYRYANGPEAVAKLLKNQVHISLFMIENLKNQYSFPLSSSEQKIFYDQALKIIQEDGLPIFLDKYFTFFTLCVDYSHDEIRSNLAEILNSKHTKKTNVSVKKQIYKTNHLKYHDLDANQSKQMYDRIVIGCMNSHEIVQQIKSQILTIPSEEKFRNHYLFILQFNTIFEFYRLYPQYESINPSNWHEFSAFLEAKKNSLSSLNYFHELEKLYYDSQNEFKRYDLRYKNIINSIQTAYVSELRLRCRYLTQELDTCESEEKRIKIQAAICNNNKIIEKIKSKEKSNG